jgi:hypothetical protein
MFSSAGSLRSSQESSSSANSSKQLLAGTDIPGEAAADQPNVRKDGRLRGGRIRTSSIAPEPDTV